MISKTSKKLPTIVIDSQENDDWIRSLPGAESERKLMDEILSEVKEKGTKQDHASDHTP